MRPKNLVTLIAIVFVISTLSISLVSSVLGKADVKIKVYNSLTDAEITDAIVILEKLNLGTDEDHADYTNGYYTSGGLYNDGQRLKIKISRTGYEDFETEIIINAYSYPTFVEEYSITPISNQMFLVTERFSTTPCEDDGFDETLEFEDNGENTIYHCTKKEPFTPGSEYIVNSYIQQEPGGGDVCDEPGFEKDGDDFEGANEQLYYLCVKKEDVDDFETEPIFRDAKVVKNDDCPSGFENVEDEVDITEENYITHCINTDTDLEDRHECKLEEVYWANESLGRIDNYIVGSEEKVYLYVNWELCEDEEIEFEITRSGGTVEIGTFVGTPRLEVNTGSKKFTFFNWESGPAWLPERTPLPPDYLEYKFTAKVVGENIKKESDTLTVFPEKGPCEKDSDCAQGEICNDENKCIVPETSDCDLTEAKWYKGSALWTEDSAAVKGFVKGDPSYALGEPMTMIVDGTDGCFSDEIEIIFTVWEDNLFFNNKLEEVRTFEKKFFYPNYELPWDPDVFEIFINYIIEIFGEPVHKYYFVAEVVDKNEKVESYTIKVKKPDPAGFCDSDECKEQGEEFVCENNVCVDSTKQPCDLEEATWYDYKFDTLTEKVKGYETEAEKEETAPLILFVRKVENVEGACEGKTIEFDVIEYDYGFLTPETLKSFDESTSGMYEAAEEIISENIEYSQDEVALALWQPQWIDEPKDPDTGENEYRFRARIKDTEIDTLSPQISVYLRKPTSTTSKSDGDSDSGTSANDFLDLGSQLLSFMN